MLVNVLSIVLPKVDLSYSRRRDLERRASMRSERWSFAWMNLNHINSRGKNDWHVLCLDLEWRQISFTLLLVNCRDVTVEFIKRSGSLTKARTMFFFQLPCGWHREILPFPHRNVSFWFRSLRVCWSAFCLHSLSRDHLQCIQSPVKMCPWMWKESAASTRSRTSQSVFLGAGTNHPGSWDRTGSETREEILSQ